MNQRCLVTSAWSPAAISDLAAAEGVFRLLRAHSELRRLFLAHTISRAGDAFNTVALVVLVFNLTGSGLGVAGAVMFEGVPVLILGPVAGLAADRLPRRRLMVGADVFRCVAALGLVVVTDAVRCRLRRGLRIVRRSGSVQPRRRVALPDVIGEHDVVEANSAMWTITGPSPSTTSCGTPRGLSPSQSGASSPKLPTSGSSRSPAPFH